MQTLSTQVLIIGGGPVGLSLTALLAKQGIRSIVVEADEGYCTGSRAICVSRRSQEIFSWIGADAALLTKGLPWTGGRSYYRDTEVLHFSMPHEPTQRFAPMVNIQQFYIEQFAHEAAQRCGDASQVLWAHRLTALTQTDAQAIATVTTPSDETLRVEADYAVACDGGRSTVREQLGLSLKGTQYEGRYVIVDIKQSTQRAVERLAWFDPPSNPGSTILMHRQPDDVWRIDYQIADDEDAAQAILPENVLPKVQSHLTMIGETAPWEALWISMYNAKCLTLDNYRHGRVFFAGDAAHLVPIFGVRGLNSGLDDAANLAWKLAAALRQPQTAYSATLLHSYSAERRHAALENMAYGAKSTEFMAPPTTAFELLRQATLRLALHNPAVRSLINPRQSAPVAYANSPLNGAQTGEWRSQDAAPGAPAPEALLMVHGKSKHLSQYFGHGAVCLYFGHMAPSLGTPYLHITPSMDAHGQAYARYGVTPDCAAVVLVRPDGYVQARHSGEDGAALIAALNETLSSLGML